MALVDLEARRAYHRNYMRTRLAADPEFREKHYARVARNNERYQREAKDAIREHLLAHPCVDCGEPDPVVLEFDHVRGEKKANVADLVKSHRCTVKAVLEEIAKCEVRCANCHRRATHRRRIANGGIEQLGSSLGS